MESLIDDLEAIGFGSEFSCGKEWGYGAEFGTIPDGRSDMHFSAKVVERLLLLDALEGKMCLGGSLVFRYYVVLDERQVSFYLVPINDDLCILICSYAVAFGPDALRMRVSDPEEVRNLHLHLGQLVKCTLSNVWI